MLSRLVLQTAVLALSISAISLGSPQTRERWDDVIAVKDVPFCALILSNFYDKNERERTIDILMEPHNVNEDNLALLFRAVSEKFPDEPTLKVWVNTNVKQLATLATGIGGSGPSQRRRELQLAFYQRTPTLELFRYNPNYPKRGEKTVLIRGREN